MFNSNTDYPEEPHPGAWYPSSQDKPRFYECVSRSILTVPRIAGIRIEVKHTDPKERFMPTQQTHDNTKFMGTLCSALDLLWVTKRDLDKLQSDKYGDWAGSVKELPEPHLGGEHKYICDIVAGYYIKTVNKPTKKFAILYPFRPFKSLDGEPEIAVMELDDEDNFAKDATV